MAFPEFFQHVTPLIVQDPLAALLGAADDGVIEYRYVDAVKLAGHSCPTVAGAWLIARHGLAALYPESLPQRGGLRVEMCAAQDAGTTGVVGAVLGLITGAAGEGGFKGLGGVHVRRGLLGFGLSGAGIVRLSRLDSGAAAWLDYHPERVPPAPEMQPLMAKIFSGTAEADERRAFGTLWQERVRRILLEHGDDAELVSVRLTD